MRFIIIILIFFSFSASGQVALFHSHNTTEQPLLLDIYTGAYSAYSMRKLRNAYTGNCIRVRRSSDNSEQNIGFTANGDLDTAAMKSFVGSSDGFVVTWFDQVGNRDLTQINAGTQPRIIASGVVERMSGRPSINNTGNKALGTLGSTPWATGTESSFTLVTRITQVFNTNLEYLTVSPTTNQGIGINPHINSTVLDFVANDAVAYFNGFSSGRSPRIITNGAIYSQNVNYLTYLSLGSDSRWFVNNTEASYRVRLSTTVTSQDLLFSLGGVYTGYFSELIVWHSNQNSNRTGIQLNVNAYYSLY